MSERFILAAKNFDENNKFKGLDGFEVFEIEDIHGDFQGWIDDNLNGQEEVYLLVHFGQVSTETELCEKIEFWKTRINKENVTILPFPGEPTVKTQCNCMKKSVQVRFIRPGT